MTSLADLCRPWEPGVAPLVDQLDHDPSDLSDLARTYRDQGYVILPGLITDDLIDDYALAWYLDNVSGTSVRPGGWPYDVPYMHVPAARELCCDRWLADVLESLVGEPMAVHLNLTGWRSTQRNWHQDGYLNPDCAADWYAAVWVALDDIHPDSGPFEYVPGSHREFGVIRHDLMRQALEPHERGPDWPKHSERILTPIFEDAIRERGMQVERFLAKRGDVLIWHPRLLHRGSAPVDVGLERRALIAHYSGIHHRPDFVHGVRQHGGGHFFPIAQEHR